jgi:hypothetical protein
LKNQALGLVSEEMNRKLGGEVSIISIVELKIKLEELLRKAVRKMEKTYREYDREWLYPILLGQREYQLIAKEKKGLTARLCLIKMLLNKEVYLQDVKKALEAIANVLRDKNE